MIRFTKATELLQFALSDLREDPFIAIREATIEHRKDHGCGAYTYDKGPLLAAVSRLRVPEQVLEIGTALGYTALCLSEGRSSTTVTTIEMDTIHVELARSNFGVFDRADRIEVIQGSFSSILPTLVEPQDLIFFDGFDPDMEIYGHILRLSRPGTVLVSANLSLAGVETQKFKDTIGDSAVWNTVYVDDNEETALCIKV